ncbi:MAG: hypothetical protein K2I63_01510, partial [Helicobacter sp.]|nr:hypothetical protein [Helicobacter sp.]
MNPIILALSLTLIVFIILFIREKIQNTSLLQSKKLLTKALTDLESLQSKFQEQIQINSSLATKLTLKEEALSQKDKDLLTIKEEHQKNYHALQIHFQENLSQLQMYHKENLKIQQQEYQNIEKNMQEQMQNYFKQQNENLFHQNKLAFNTD